LTQNKFGHNKIKTNGDLYDYQEMIRMKYPDEWERKFKNKWSVRIIYYDKNNNVETYQFYVDRNSNMTKIMFMFKNYLICQKITLINCFGYDIAENILSYMPTLLEISDIINNYIYVHIRPYERINTGKEDLINITERIKVPDNMSVNRVHGQISAIGLQQESRYTILRLRTKPYPITKSFKIKNILI
jgi:hypothetical protein